MTYGAAAAAVLTAIALVGCGGDENEGNPIPGREAERMITLLDLAESQSANGTCGGATAKVREARGIAEGLPRSVNADVRRELQSGLDRLEELIASECRRPEPEPEDTATVTTPEPTETTPEPTETTPEPTTTTPEPEPTTPEPEPEPTTTVPGNPGTGGTPPGQENDG